MLFLNLFSPSYILNREWTAKQRQKYSQGRLSPERQQLLDTVGFVYRINKQVSRKSTTREDKKWWGQLERLTHFLLEHGHVSEIGPCFFWGACFRTATLMKSLVSKCILSPVNALDFGAIPVC